MGLGRLDLRPNPVFLYFLGWVQLSPYKLDYTQRPSPVTGPASDSVGHCACMRELRNYFAFVTTEFAKQGNRRRAYLELLPEDEDDGEGELVNQCSPLLLFFVPLFSNFLSFFFCFILFFLCLCSLVFDYVSVSFVMSSLRLLPCSLFPGFFCVLPWVSPPIFSLVCVLWPPPLDLSLFTLCLFSPSQYVCLSLFLFFCPFLQSVYMLLSFSVLSSFLAFLFARSWFSAFLFSLCLSSVFLLFISLSLHWFLSLWFSVFVAPVLPWVLIAFSFFLCPLLSPPQKKSLWLSLAFKKLEDGLCSYVRAS